MKPEISKLLVNLNDENLNQEMNLDYSLLGEKCKNLTYIGFDQLFEFHLSITYTDQQYSLNKSFPWIVVSYVDTFASITGT